MKYNRLGYTDRKISAVCLGGWPFGGGYDWGPVDEESAACTVHTALEQGVNLIDTAPIYGNGAGEMFLGRILGAKRKRVLVATKCGLVKTNSWPVHDLHPLSIRTQLEGSLARLGTDYIDLYQLHYPDPKIPLCDSLGELVRLKQEGKLRYIGVCNFSTEQLKEACRYAEIVSVQNEYSLLHPQQGASVFSFCREKEISFLSYGTLCGGILSGKYRKEPNFRRADARNYFYKCYQGEAFLEAQKTVARIRNLATAKNVAPAVVAVGWVLSCSAVSGALVGARTTEQLCQNVQGAEIHLSAQDLAYLEGKVCSCTK